MKIKTKNSIPIWNKFFENILLLLTIKVKQKRKIENSMMIYSMNKREK